MHLTADMLREAVALPAPNKVLHGLIDASAAKAAAVLVPIVLEPEPSVILVLRGAHLKDHAGEVGFPGGKPEPGDADLYATALREAEEEVALSAEHVSPVGALAPVPVITGRYMIHPFVGVVAPRAAPRPASPEIAELLRLPIGPLLRGDRPFSAVVGTWLGVEMFSPFFEVDVVAQAETIDTPGAVTMGGDPPCPPPQAVTMGGDPPARSIQPVILYGASAYIFYELLAKIAARLGLPLPDARIASELPWGNRYSRA